MVLILNPAGESANEFGKAKAGPARTVWAVRGDLLDFVARPSLGRHRHPAVRFDRDHWLLIEHGRIVGRQSSEPDASWVREDAVPPDPAWLHRHPRPLPADRVLLGSYGTELLDWLARYTFPAERAFADPARSRGGQALPGCLLAHGTTSAVVFPPSTRSRPRRCFEGAQAPACRLITGKVLMDRHAPACGMTW